MISMKEFIETYNKLILLLTRLYIKPSDIVKAFEYHPSELEYDMFEKIDMNFSSDIYKIDIDKGNDKIGDIILVLCGPNHKTNASIICKKFPENNSLVEIKSRYWMFVPEMKLAGYFNGENSDSDMILFYKSFISKFISLLFNDNDKYITPLISYIFIRYMISDYAINIIDNEFSNQYNESEFNLIKDTANKIYNGSIATTGDVVYVLNDYMKDMYCLNCSEE